MAIFIFPFVVLLISMLISDFLIGFHKYVFFTYIPLVIITLIFKDKILKYKNMLFYSFIGVIIFYLISNFGVWILDKNYEKNIYGLLNCYIAALPFLKNSIISTIFFTYLTFSTYKFSKKLIFKSWDLYICIMNNKIVYVGLTADTIHHGHINLIEKARKYGQVLIVNSGYYSEIINYMSACAKKALGKIKKKVRMLYCTNLETILVEA